MKNLRLPILLIFGLLSSLASAKEIYVASFGKDSNPGSQNEPYATLGKAFTVLENDDKIFILDILSIQNEASGTGTGQMEDDCLGIKFPSDKKNIVIQGISPETSGIDGQSVLKAEMSPSRIAISMPADHPLFVTEEPFRSITPS